MTDRKEAMDRLIAQDADLINVPTQTDALKIARDALERIWAATDNEARAGDKGYISRYGIHGIARAALEQSK